MSFLPLGQVNTTDKMSVRLRQQVGDVPVEGGYLNLLFALDGSLLSVQNTGAVISPGANTTPALSEGFARRSAKKQFETIEGVHGHLGESELVFTRVTGPIARLAWNVDVHNDAEMLGTKFVIDAQNGQILGTSTLIHHFDVTGQVVTNATTGTAPDGAGNPPVQLPLPLARVTSSAGTVFADANGNFTFPGVNTPLNVTVEYVGEFYEVFNDAGVEYTLTQNLPANTPNTIVMNPGSTPLVTAQANAHIGSHDVREFIKAVDPADNTADFNIVSNANLNSTCNAFFNGSSINFFQAGGGCVNTSYSTVVAHELGHWLNVLYGTGNGSDGMGEANADVFAMYTYDDPAVGQDFFGAGSNVRTGTNTRPYCGDGNGGCYGQVHTDGEVWMGAAWKIRRNLNITHGNAMGDMISNTLFLGWMNGFDQTTIDSIIETQWLTLDDNDGNINNGTPNYGDIDAAFVEQGFPGFDLPLIEIVSLTQVADSTDGGVPFQVDSNVISLIGGSISGVDLIYSINGAPLQTAAMSNMGGGNWRGFIPAQPQAARVSYYVTATDNLANTETFPDPSEAFRFNVGVLTAILVTDFEAAGNEGWQGGVGGDTATTGVWVRVDPNGTAAQTEDDHTPGAGVTCWVTGQGSVGGSTGENDVDGGITTLLSPTFDLTGFDNVEISYWRWFANQLTMDDRLRVGISNNGGSTWQSVEVIGPGGPGTNGGWINFSFDPSSFVVLTANMRLRFIAEDIGSASFSEAAIDDIEITDLADGDSCPSPSNYCVGATNSTGQGASISILGSQSVADNNFGLLVSDAPANRSGLFFYGANQGQIPFGDGFRCISGSFFRLNPITMTDGLGNASRAVDLTNPPSAAGQITANSTWNFQFWFRDPGGPGGNGFNLTDGVEVPFCD